MDRRRAPALAALLLALSPPLAAQERVRVDFEGSAARPAAGATPAPYVPGPRARIDFEGRAAPADGPAAAAYTPGPRARYDFEASASATAPAASGTGSPPPPPPPPPARASDARPLGPMPLPPGAAPASPARPLPPIAMAVAVIDSIAPSSCVPPSGVVTVHGRGFGASAGDRHLALAGKPPHPLATRSWSDTRITASLPPAAMSGMSYALVLHDAKGQPISNNDRRVVVCR